MVKNCERCGKLFVAMRNNQKYCGKKCRIEAHNATNRAKYIRCNKNEQLCWRCSKATGGCPWSATGEHIEGWAAKPVDVKSRYTNDKTYHITACPLFDEEKDYYERMLRD